MISKCCIWSRYGNARRSCASTRQGEPKDGDKRGDTSDVPHYLTYRTYVPYTVYVGIERPIAPPVWGSDFGRWAANRHDNDKVGR